MFVYFTILKDLWDESDAIHTSRSVKYYVEQLEFQHLLQFFMGLNDIFEQGKSQILLMHSIPTISQAYLWLYRMKAED